MRVRAGNGVLTVALSILAATAGCSGPADTLDEPVLTLGAYTTPREVYNRAIIPAFQQFWRERTGQTVRFRESYLASGAQSRAIVGGFEADIAALSLEADLDRIARDGLIRHDWETRPYDGMVTTSIVVIAVRENNPLGIQDWTDLTRTDINILTPDPRTSGGAMWNISALYGAALRGFVEGVPPQDPEKAKEFLERVLKNVSIMDKGARESIINFERGVGDVALTYENEVLVGRQAGESYDYIVPRSTLMIENPVALIDEYVDRHGVRPVAEAFLDFLWSEESQRAYARFGLRPVDPQVAAEVRDQYPEVQDLWTIDFLGGWERVIPEIFGPEGVYTQLHEKRSASQ